MQCLLWTRFSQLFPNIKMGMKAYQWQVCTCTACVFEREHNSFIHEYSHEKSLTENHHTGKPNPVREIKLDYWFLHCTHRWYGNVIIHDSQLWSHLKKMLGMIKNANSNWNICGMQNTWELKQKNAYQNEAEK